MKLDFSSPFTERTPRVVNAAKLHRAKERKKAGRILVEGFNSVDAAISTGAATDLFVTQSAAERYADVVTAAGYLDVYVHAIDDKAAASLSETVTTPGIFAVCRPVLWTVGKALGRKPQLVTVPVETSEPGNAGTLMRVSDSMGADAVIFAGNTVDPQSNKAARASAGSLFHIPVAREPNIKQVLGQLRSAGLQILATAADGDVTLDQVDLAKPTAWLLGNEAHGLDDDLLNEADIRVSIPIRGRAESLNLATAAAICLYQSAQAQEAEE
ncbi:TrmH family RNA methyltransferase [Corynebacterium tapiri]|uniref:RNA methyltransferase n=1 Tax=Corynebacterium tapiri TaxID=1448266 RepID=A0A5C4U786_9CORY|nr:RNA methyltransferase [Corynebacterium tapiri]TNL99847.1 RNA methyltransferase [Corynebacterium tapiri]